MGWNYRIVRTEEKFGNEIEVTYAVHEAYYAKKGDTIPNGLTVNPVSVMSEDRMGILSVLAKMAEAVRQPILESKGDKLVEVEPEKAFGDDLMRAIKSVEAEATP